MKTDHRANVSVQMLRSALLELLKANRIHTITVKAICEKAGMHRSTFYRYYGSPFELLDDIQVYLLDLLLDYDMTNFDHEAAFVRFLTVIQKHHEWFQVILNCPDANFVQRLAESDITKIGCAYIVDHHGDSSMEVYARNYLTYGFFSSIKVWLNNENPEPIETLVRYYKQINGNIFHTI